MQGGANRGHIALMSFFQARLAVFHQRKKNGHPKVPVLRSELM
jgi:hypothetical protein